MGAREQLQQQRAKTQARLDSLKTWKHPALVSDQIESLTKKLARIDHQLAQCGPGARSDGHAQARMDTRELAPQERINAARDRRARLVGNVPFNQHAARAYADAASAVAEAKRGGGDLDDVERPSVIHAADGTYAACPQCDGRGAMPDDDEKACDACDGVGAVKLSSIKDAATASRVKSALGFFGGTEGQSPSDPGAPFQPTPKGGTPRDEERELEYAASPTAHKDGGRRLVVTHHGRLTSNNNSRPMPLAGAVDRSGVERAKAARAQLMDNLPFNRGKLAERLRASGFAKPVK